MRQLVGFVVMMGCTAAVLAQEGESAQPDAEGFVALFNGKDLAHWKIVGDPAGFQVVDGVIRSETGGGGQWMYFDQEQFTDFILRVEWRVSARGNSGVFLRVPPEGQPWVTGYEAQISCEEPARDELHCTGSLYGYAAVNPRPEETPEKWRLYEITCVGAKITVKLDGQVVCELDQTTKEETRDKPLKGHVGVQDSHGPAGTWVEYRSIKIKELATQEEPSEESP